jgi:hypothetical protein
MYRHRDVLEIVGEEKIVKVFRCFQMLKVFRHDLGGEKPLFESDLTSLLRGQHHQLKQHNS